MINKKNIEVIDASSVTVEEFAEKIKRGYALYRTSHIGNHYLSNMLLDLIGIQCSLFDRNHIYKDINYFPKIVICGGKKYIISKDSNTLVPFAEFDFDFSKLCPHVNGETNPLQVHAKSLRKVYNNFNIESEMLLENIGLFRELLENILYHNPDSFTKIVNINGETSFVKYPPKNAVEMVINLHRLIVDKIYGRDISWFIQGISIKVEAIILITTIIAAIRSGKNEVYEFSGPDMIKYALRNSFKFKIRNLYALLGKNMPQLPNELRLHVVPSFYFRFGALKSEADLVDDFLKNLIAYNKINTEKRIQLKAIKKDKTKSTFEKIDEGFVIREKYNPKLSEYAKKIHSNKIINRIVYNLNDKNFFTQYDLIESGEKLYIPSKVMNLTMKECQILYEVIEKSKQYL